MCEHNTWVYREYRVVRERVRARTRSQIQAKEMLHAVYILPITDSLTDSNSKYSDEYYLEKFALVLR